MKNGTDSYLSQVKMSDLKKTKPRSPSPTGQKTYPAGSIRERVLKSAFSLFSESGFSATSMLDIVTRREFLNATFMRFSLSVS